MNAKILSALLFLVVSTANSALYTAYVSPYIDRGISLRLRGFYNDLSVIHHYEKAATGDRYSMYSSTVYLTPFEYETLFLPVAYMDAYLIFGAPNEKLELSVSLLGFLRRDIKIRPKFNHINKGENRLFRNIAISSFAQFEFRRFRYDWSNLHANLRTATDKDLFAYYLGVAIGTRKKTNNDSYFQLFTSPQISLTHYRKLGGGMFDPANFAHGYNKYEKFDLLVPDLSVPLVVGLKLRNFIIKGGGAITTTLGGNARHLNRGDSLADKVVVDSFKFPFFTEIGFQF
ncbi:MAG: hypothetical protein FWE23_00260 [Chitinivibrionia bacterium]|nr:hypothetical protein [Chitinivibrionia bacterium]